MSGCKRWALVLLLCSLALLGFGGLGLWLKLPIDASLLGMLAGIGATGLFASALVWFWPGNLRDSAPPALTRRYYREFTPPMAAYVGVMLVWKPLLQRVDAVGLRVLIALLPAGLIVLAIRAVARFIRDSDEMQRRIELESLAISGGILGAGYMTAGFLQTASLIDIPASAAMLWVFPCLCATYGVAKLLISRHYL
ncbi:hypothetical protein CSC70_02110 [Pseudoxanthomonas kalamensis DSM 18571]|uniref:hypothetical protein n=1 Tax=Pseudoxanthomonas kalamensis TaxID=289483 RepID=UPI001391E2AC|nr:hypothetical protein [Pseudoxanthomonas kalamensis]KAF1712339.1 hypothetical protein CSC70_02110 [Pseudoxanthomonas kalamensis DSM 18571]